VILAHLKNDRLELMEKPVCIVCCFKLWKNATETFKTFEVAFGEHTMETTTFWSGFPSLKAVSPSV
jgi:hypothetical protein